MADAGRSPVTEAALVKEMATRFEQDVVAAVADHYGRPVGLERGPEELDRLLAKATLTGPSWTIRGGTTEILRGVVSRALTGPASDVDAPGGIDPLLWSTADKIFADTCTPAVLAGAESSRLGRATRGRRRPRPACPGCPCRNGRGSRRHPGRRARGVRAWGGRCRCRWPSPG